MNASELALILGYCALMMYGLVECVAMLLRRRGEAYLAEDASPLDANLIADDLWGWRIRVPMWVSLLGIGVAPLALSPVAEQWTQALCFLAFAILLYVKQRLAIYYYRKRDELLRQ